MQKNGRANNKMKKTILPKYTLYVESAYCGKNWKDVQRLNEDFKHKYGVEVHFPIEDSTRSRFELNQIDIPRKLDVLDGIIEILEENGYNIKGFSRKVIYSFLE